MRFYPVRILYACAGLAVLLHASAAPASAGRSICYKVTSKMWDPAAEKAVPTSPEMLRRVRRAFGLWEEASAGALEFRDEGFSAPRYDSANQVPFDGCIHVALFGGQNFHGELAHGQFNGTIPGEYKRGYIFVNCAGPAQDAGTLIHEIGHTLGLPHSATPASALFSGDRAGGRGEPPALSEQDGAALRALWAPGSPGVYSVSGTISTTRAYPVAFVFAVNIRNGRTYSCRSDHMGRFSIAVAEPGSYRLAAKGAEVSMDLLPAARTGKSAGWYVADGVSDEQPDRAAVLELSPSGPSIKGLKLKTIDTDPPFHLTRASVRGPARLSSLKPGDEVVLGFPEAGGGLAAVEAYGSAPDYSFAPVPGPGGRAAGYKLKVSPGAEPGERLVVARGRDGRSTVGLVGIHILPQAGSLPPEERPSPPPAEPAAPVPEFPAASSPAGPAAVPEAARGAVLLLSFDYGFDDEGPYRLKAVLNGDEVRLAPGRKGQALFTGGTADWVDVPVSRAIPLSGGYTIELWVRRDDWENPYKGGSGWQTIAAIGGSASLSITAPGCPLHKPWSLEGSASRYRKDVKETESSRVLSAPGSVAAKRWVHAALVYDRAAGALLLYKDGHRVDTALGAPPVELGPGHLRLGTWYRDNQAFRGEIDEVAVYNYPRSAAEIAADAGPGVE